MRILIVEDERPIAENLYDFLESCGHQCDFAPSLAVANALLRREEFDALILDRSLPDGDGATLASRLRSTGNFVPILMLTARDTLDDKLAGFDAGADDYLAKPFALKEVEARLQALLRRAGGRAAAERLVFGALAFDPAAQTVTLGDDIAGPAAQGHPAGRSAAAATAARLLAPRTGNRHLGPPPGIE